MSYKNELDTRVLNTALLSSLLCMCNATAVVKRICARTRYTTCHQQIINDCVTLKLKFKSNHFNINKSRALNTRTINNDCS